MFRSTAIRGSLVALVATLATLGSAGAVHAATPTTLTQASPVETFWSDQPDRSSWTAFVDTGVTDDAATDDDVPATGGRSSWT